MARRKNISMAPFCFIIRKLLIPTHHHTGCCPPPPHSKHPLQALGKYLKRNNFPGDSFVCHLSHGRSANCYDPAKQNSVWYNYLGNIRPSMASDNAGKGGLCFLNNLAGHCGWSPNPQINGKSSTFLWLHNSSSL